MKVDEKSSSVLFVYPFLFESDHFEISVQALEDALWYGSRQPLQIWDQQKFPEDDLLPHVARFLNPPDDLIPTARLWELTHEALHSPAAGLGGGDRSTSTEWILLTPQGEIPFWISAVQLILFRTGVGFLTVRCSVADHTGKVSDWLNLLHYFRFVRGQRDVRLKAWRRIGFNKTTTQPQLSPFFPEPAGGLQKHNNGLGTFSSIIHALLHTASVPDNSHQWWREVFIPGQAIPFATLYLTDVPDNAKSQLLFRIRNLFHANQEIHPTPEDLDFHHPELMNYANNQWFTFSLDGGAFVAYDAPMTDFFRIVLPEHLQKHYSLLYLLTLHQRFTLMMLSEQVAEHWLDKVAGEPTLAINTQRETSFEQIRDTFLEFTARGNFSQAMQGRNHHRVYKKWQDIFQLEQLYREVCYEVDLIYGCLQQQRVDRLNQSQEDQRRQTESLERRLNLIALLIGMPALMLTFVQSIGSPNPRNAAIALIGGFILGGAILAGISLTSNRNRDEG